MDTTLAADRRPGRAPTATRTRPRRLRLRKPLLVAHLIVSGTWLGAVVADLFLGISAATTGREDMADAYYAVMDRLVNNLMPATVVVGVAAIDRAIQDTIAARAADHSAAASDLLLPAIATTPLMLATAFTLAIIKPWGRTRRGRRRGARRRPSAAGRS